MLSDTEIRAALDAGDIIIDPSPVDHQIQPASIDVHLGKGFITLTQPTWRAVRLTDVSTTVEALQGTQLVLPPRSFALGRLKERVNISSSIVARIEGKSSIGRKGVFVHATAGFVDPGWDGILTIELFNASAITYLLEEGDPIAQLAFDRLETPSGRPYGHPDLKSHYQSSIEVKGSLA